MIDKEALYPADGENGPTVFPLFRRGEQEGRFEKLAAPTILPPVTRFIEQLRPQPRSQYILINALGASEYYGQNSNRDAFCERGLKHAPEGMTGDPARDKPLAKDWPHGYPTFYYAHTFVHHKNSNPDRAVGFVELSVYNDHMKRVELVCRLDPDLCARYGGQNVWAKIESGGMPDTSMGARVPFDTCLACLDKKLYEEARRTFKPGTHKNEGEAILIFHRARKDKDGVGIRGLAITRADYCQCMRRQGGQILPSGIKVGVDNDYPRFFDISLVIIGADKTSKVMKRIHPGPQSKTASWSPMSIAPAPLLPDTTEGTEKTASADLPLSIDSALSKFALLKKKSEMDKRVPPSPYDARLVKLITSREPEAPKKLLDKMAEFPLAELLASLTGQGHILRPREFQRIVLKKGGHHDLADRLHDEGAVFSSPSSAPHSLQCPFGPASPLIASLLGPLLGDRGCAPQVIEKKIIIVVALPSAAHPVESRTKTSSEPLLPAVASLYDSYRERVLSTLPVCSDPKLAELQMAYAHTAYRGTP